jgi:hypothetical protein
VLVDQLRADLAAAEFDATEVKRIGGTALRRLADEAQFLSDIIDSKQQDLEALAALTTDAQDGKSKAEAKAAQLSAELAALQQQVRQLTDAHRSERAAMTRKVDETIALRESNAALAEKLKSVQSDAACLAAELEKINSQAVLTAVEHATVLSNASTLQLQLDAEIASKVVAEDALAVSLGACAARDQRAVVVLGLTTRGIGASPSDAQCGNVSPFASSRSHDGTLDSGRRGAARGTVTLTPRRHSNIVIRAFDLENPALLLGLAKPEDAHVLNSLIACAVLSECPASTLLLQVGAAAGSALESEAL